MNCSRVILVSGPAIVCGMLAAILAVAISEIHSFDVFWQLQNGRYMFETGQMIRTDLFTLASDMPRHEHTWLHSLILFSLYKLFGYSAISVLKGGVVAATACVLVAVARKRSSSWLAISLVVPVFMLTSGGWLERPQLWTFLGTALFIWILEDYVKRPSWRLLWLLPIMVVWSNLHAGSILAVAITFAYLVGGTVQHLLQKDFTWRFLVQMTSVFVGVILAGMVNPYPNKWISVLLGSYSLGSGGDPSGKGGEVNILAMYNMDWTHTTFQREPLFYYLLVVVLFVLLLGWKRLKVSDLCLLVGLALMGNKLVRHIPFFYFGVIAILPVCCDSFVAPIQKKIPKVLLHIARVILICLSIGLFVYLWQPSQNVYGTFNTGLREWHYPIKATEFVRENKLPKNIYNTYDWGGYMAFKLYPDYLMFWDGRQSSVDMFRYGWDLMAGKAGWQSILNKFDVKTIVTRGSTIDTGQKYPLLDRLRFSNDWSLVFAADSSLVFVRNDSMPLSWLKRHALPKERIDDTLLSEAHLMVKYNPNRYMAWWSMAEIYTKRKQFKHALFAIDQHLARSPNRNPMAEKMRKQIVWAISSK